MQQAEVIRLINSFNAIKGYFDTTKKYMPQIAKLVVFIEEIIPLLEMIHENLHQSTSLIPNATEKLGKVTSATEMAAIEVMDIVDNVITRLNTMTENLDAIESNTDASNTESLSGQIGIIRAEIDGSQDDLFSIMNALQFQDITTQQINSISQTIDDVQHKLGDLLLGFREDGISVTDIKKTAYDPNAEFDFGRAADSQKVADTLLSGEESAPSDKTVSETAGTDEEAVLGDNGQPDISAIMNELDKSDENT